MTGSTCTSIEYGDTLDIMGGASSAHFNAFQKERLGWLGYGVSPLITTVTEMGTYPIDVLELAGASAKALKVLKSTDATTGKQTFYYLEYRQPLGFDGFLSGNSNVRNGLAFHLGTVGTSNSSYLLDMTPETSSWSDPALLFGKSFYDSDIGLTVAPLSGDGTTATVFVDFGPMACVRGMPTVSLSPSSTQWEPPGMTVTYTLSVTNNDNAGCTASSFAVSPVVPAGWLAAVGAAVSLAPGTSGSTPLDVTSAVDAPEGFYNFQAQVTNSDAPSYSGSASGTEMIFASLSVQAATDKAAYGRNQTIRMSATVRTGSGSPVPGVSVTFIITRADSSTFAVSATADASGTALASYRIRPKDPLGTWGLKAAATMNGVAGEATTTFAVK